MQPITLSTTIACKRLWLLGAAASPAIAAAAVAGDNSASARVPGSHPLLPCRLGSHPCLVGSHLLTMGNNKRISRWAWCLLQLLLFLLLLLKSWLWLTAYLCCHHLRHPSEVPLAYDSVFIDPYAVLQLHDSKPVRVLLCTKHLVQ
jgi:hypothetical protein